MQKLVGKGRKSAGIGTVLSFGLLMCSSLHGSGPAMGGAVDSRIIEGVVVESGLGRAIAVGDFNADGYDDLVIGYPERDAFVPSRGLIVDANGGAVRWLMGGPGGYSSDQSINGFEIPGWDSISGKEETDSAIGAALAAGDFDDDGYDDLAIGAPGRRVNGLSAGEVAIISGGLQGLDFSTAVLLSQDELAGAVESGDQFGASLAAGDLSGDGVDDLAIGVPGEDITSPFVGTDAGAVNIVYGVAGSGLEVSGNEVLHQEVAGVSLSATLQDAFGTAVVIADFTGDSQPDLAVGVPGEFVNGVDTAGVVQIFAGGPSGIDPTNNTELLISQDDVLINGSPGDQHNFGQSLAAGDFDGSGLTDLAIGIPGEDGPMGVLEHGAVLVLYSGAVGLVPVGQQFLTEVVFDPGAGSGQRFGSALAAGDINNDGYDDLAVGSPFDNFAGEVTVFFAQATGLEEGARRGLNSGAPEVFTMADFDTLALADEFGWALAMGRFFSASGGLDLAVGVPGRDVNEVPDTGMVVVLSSTVIFADRFEQGDAQRWSVSGLETGSDRARAACCRIRE